MDVCLISVCDPLATRMPVRASPFWIGRGEECHLRLNSVMVSRRHVELKLRNGRLRAYDCGSLNGTTVNGKLAGRDGIDLRAGDLLGVGSTAFIVQIIRSSDDASRIIPSEVEHTTTHVDQATRPAPR